MDQCAIFTLNWVFMAIVEAAPIFQQAPLN